MDDYRLLHEEIQKFIYTGLCSDNLYPTYGIEKRYRQGKVRDVANYYRYIPGPVVKLRHHTCVCYYCGSWGYKPPLQVLYGIMYFTLVLYVVTALMHYIPYDACRGVLTIA